MVKRQGAAGEGPVALPLMLAVGGQIGQVVDDIYGRRGAAEGEEHQQRVAPCHQVEQRAGGHDRHEHQDVLDPLVRTQRLDEGTGPGDAVIDMRFDPGDRRRRLADAFRRIHQHGGSRVPPDLQIGEIVAGIGVGLPVKVLVDRLRLGGTPQVVEAVGGDHLIEQTDMLRHRIGYHMIGGGRQDQPPAKPLLLMQPGDQTGIVGQQRRIEPAHAAPVAASGAPCP